MKITGRVRKLEAAIKPGECRACRDELIGLMYDPPHEHEPVVFAGKICPPAQCPQCGRWPRLLIKIPWDNPAAAAAREAYPSPHPPRAAVS